MNWEMLGAITASVGLINSACIWAIRMMIANAIQQNNEILLERINGTYTRSAEQKLRDDFLMSTLSRKLDAAECIHRREQRDGGPISNH